MTVVMAAQQSAKVLTGSKHNECSCGYRRNDKNPLWLGFAEADSEILKIKPQRLGYALR
jgi:hypothetical protein